MHNLSFLLHYFLTIEFCRSISNSKNFPHFSVGHNWYCQLVDLILSCLTSRGHFRKLLSKIKHQVHLKILTLLPSFSVPCTFLSHNFQLNIFLETASHSSAFIGKSNSQVKKVLFGRKKSQRILYGTRVQISYPHQKMQRGCLWFFAKFWF